MTAAVSHITHGFSLPAALQPGRLTTLGTIILLHVGLLYALRNSVPHEPAPPAPAKEIVAAFIIPQPAPAPQPAPQQPAIVKKPEPPAEKAAPRPKPLPKPSKPSKPEMPPSPRAITEPPAPPSPPAPAEPVAPPVAAAPAQPRTVASGSIEYIHAPQPEYPMVSRRMGEQGKAVLRILVDEKGRPERVEVQQSSGSARLDEAARKAMSRWLFKPLVENGKPVSFYVTVPFKFELNS